MNITVILGNSLVIYLENNFSQTITIKSMLESFDILEKSKIPDIPFPVIQKLAMLI